MHPVLVECKLDPQAQQDALTVSHPHADLGDAINIDLLIDGLASRAVAKTASREKTQNAQKCEMAWRGRAGYCPPIGYDSSSVVGNYPRYPWGIAFRRHNSLLGQ